MYVCVCVCMGVHTHSIKCGDGVGCLQANYLKKSTLGAIKFFNNFGEGREGIYAFWPLFILCQPSFVLRITLLGWAEF